MQQDTPTFEVRGLVKFAQVPKWVIRHRTLSVGAKALYADIMTYADNDTLAAFPSREVLADDLGVSVSTVKRSIKELETANVITVERRRNRRTGNFYANHYVLAWSAPAEESPWVTDDPRREVASDPRTTPTVLPTPTRTSQPSPVPDEVQKTSEPRTLRVRAALSLQDQLHIDEDTATGLLQLAYQCWRLGDDGPWTDLTEDLQDAAGIDCVDGMVWDYGFRERLDCIMRDTQAEGKSVRYGLSEWLCTLTHTTRATA